MQKLMSELYQKGSDALLIHQSACEVQSSLSSLVLHVLHKRVRHNQHRNDQVLATLHCPVEGSAAILYIGQLYHIYNEDRGATLTAVHSILLSCCQQF